MEAAEEMVDALVLDETDVVGQRAGLVGDTLDLVMTSQLNVDDDDDDDEEEESAVSVSLSSGECTRSVCPGNMQKRPPALDP